MRWADVIVESFSPRGRASLGLDYEQLHELRPGPDHDVELPVRPDRPAAPLRRLRHDGRLAVGVLPPHRLAGPPAVRAVRGLQRLSVAAVRAVRRARRARPPRPHRRGAVPRLRPGRGVRSTSSSPALLDRAVNGHEWTRNGNADPDMAPHGVYPASGDDQWVALACRDDADWRALAELLGRRDLAVAVTPRTASLGATSWTTFVAAWTAPRTPTSDARRADRRRRARPHRAELRRVHGRPPARPPRALGRRCPTRARHDRRRGDAHAAAQRHPGRGAPASPRSSARTPSTCSPSCSATTTTASASCSPPAPWIESNAQRHAAHR